MLQGRCGSVFTVSAHTSLTGAQTRVTEFYRGVKGDSHCVLQQQQILAAALLASLHTDL